MGKPGIRLDVLSPDFSAKRQHGRRKGSAEEDMAKKKRLQEQVANGLITGLTTTPLVVATTRRRGIRKNAGRGGPGTKKICQSCSEKTGHEVLQIDCGTRFVTPPHSRQLQPKTLQAVAKKKGQLEKAKETVERLISEVDEAKRIAARDAYILQQGSASGMQTLVASLPAAQAAQAAPAADGALLHEPQEAQAEAVELANEH